MATQKVADPAGAWWVRLAKPLVRDYEAGFVALSRELAKKVGRPKPWSHAALVRFVANGQCSADLAAAISAYFKLPRPAFVARSVKEAWEMEAVASKYENTPPLSALDQEIIELEERLAKRRLEAEAKALRDAAAARPRKSRAKHTG